MTSNLTVQIRFLIVLMSVCSLVGCRTSEPAKHYTELSFTQLRDIDIPDVTHITLDNGMQLLLLEDHELPLIHMSAMIRTGSIYDPPDQIGLADITGMVMRTGGTLSRTGDEIDELLEGMAASVETSIGLNSGNASASALKEDIDTVIAVFADVLMHPAFREEKIQIAKMQHRSSISRRNDYPNRIALREYKKLIYGPQSVYARHTEYTTIDRITREDLLAFHKRYFGPNNMILAVWGDFEIQEMIKKINLAFTNWQKVDDVLVNMQEVNYAFRSTVNQIQKDDINQSNIFLGHIGGIKNDPDYFSLIVTNEILGAPFTGRLFKNVRSRQGLAYSTFGVYTANYTHPGVFYVGCQTKSESTAKAIRAMLHEVKTITLSEVTDEELSIAKESFLNAFIFNFDTKGEIIERLMTYAYYDYPANFLQQIKENVENVNKQDVLRVAQKHFKPEAMQILVVGRTQDFDEPLSIFGDVKDIDITIPPPDPPDNN